MALQVGFVGSGLGMASCGGERVDCLSECSTSDGERKEAEQREGIGGSGVVRDLAQEKPGWKGGDRC